jgi:PRTRC genetic system protein E
MFRELMPILDGRQVLLTVSRVDEATIRLCVVPKRLKEDAGENGLCTPLTVTGAPDELDREFATQVAGYTASVAKLSSNLAVEAAHTAALKAVREDKKKELDRKRGKPSSTSSHAAGQTNDGPTIKDGKPVFGTKGGAGDAAPMNLFDAPSSRAESAGGEGRAGGGPDHAIVIDDASPDGASTTDEAVVNDE